MDDFSLEDLQAALQSAQQEKSTVCSHPMLRPAACVCQNSYSLTHNIASCGLLECLQHAKSSQIYMANLQTVGQALGQERS